MKSLTLLAFTSEEGEVARIKRLFIERDKINKSLKDN
jgi:hypothetical protein